MISQGDPSVFAIQPISGALLLIAVLIMVVPPLLRLRQRRRLASS
jgi:TctA family transporter